LQDYLDDARFDGDIIDFLWLSILIIMKIV
jgi:hypothetical protein